MTFGDSAFHRHLIALSAEYDRFMAEVVVLSLFGTGIFFCVWATTAIGEQRSLQKLYELKQ